MDYLISRNAGDRTLAAIEEIVGAVGPVMVFEPGTYETGTLKDRLADAIREAPNTPITFVMNFKDSTFVNWASPLLDILQSRIVLGETLPEKSNIILLSEMDTTQFYEPGTSALLARLEVFDLIAIVAKYPHDADAVINHEIGHLANSIQEHRFKNAVIVFDNTLNSNGASYDSVLTGSPDSVMKSWRELADKHPNMRVLGRVSQSDAFEFSDFYFNDGQLTAKRGVHREMAATYGPNPAAYTTDPALTGPWLEKLKALKAKPDDLATPAQIEGIKKAIAQGDFLIEISPAPKKPAPSTDLNPSL